MVTILTCGDASEIDVHVKNESRVPQPLKYTMGMGSSIWNHY